MEKFPNPLASPTQIITSITESGVDKQMKSTSFIKSSFMVTSHMCDVDRPLPDIGFYTHCRLAAVPLVVVVVMSASSMLGYKLEYHY